MGMHKQHPRFKGVKEMGRYIINETIHSFDKLRVDDIDIIKNNSSLYVINVNKTCDNDINKYYKFIRTAVRLGNRVILISKDDGNTSFRTLANLMISFGAYDVYQIPAEKIITINYLNKLIDHRPTFDEVATYVGGDVAAYNSLDTLMMGIESLTKEGNVQGLENFMDQHSIELDSLISTLNYMKGICNSSNSQEQVEQIKNLNEEIDKLQDTLKKRDSKVTELSRSNEVLQENLSNIKTENETLKIDNKELKDEKDGLSGFAIRSYKPVNMSLLKSTTQIILYFKEVSYVRYVNSLIHNIMYMLNTQGLKSKLLVYDNNPSYSPLYNGFTAVTGDVYKNAKSTIISKSSSVLIVEPIQNLLDDILQYPEGFDVIVIYDRMKGTDDIVKGNLVSKFFVINSSSDFNNISSNLKIERCSNVIIPSGSSLVTRGIIEDPLDIGTINGYSKLTDVAKIARYNRLMTSNNKLLINEIFGRSKVDKIVNR